jgi:hypothetical protein
MDLKGDDLVEADKDGSASMKEMGQKVGESD